jgi:hypothetical protein
MWGIVKDFNLNNDTKVRLLPAFKGISDCGHRGSGSTEEAKEAEYKRRNTDRREAVANAATALAVYLRAVCAGTV